MQRFWGGVFTGILLLGADLHHKSDRCRQSLQLKSKRGGSSYCPVYGQEGVDWLFFCQAGCLKNLLLTQRTLRPYPRRTLTRPPLILRPCSTNSCAWVSAWKPTPRASCGSFIIHSSVRSRSSVCSTTDKHNASVILLHSPERSRMTTHHDLRLLAALAVVGLVPGVVQVLHGEEERLDELAALHDPVDNKCTYNLPLG